MEDFEGLHVEPDVALAFFENSRQQLRPASIVRCLVAKLVPVRKSVVPTIFTRGEGSLTKSLQVNSSTVHL